MQLFVWNETSTTRIPTKVLPVTTEDIQQTKNWQTNWASPAAMMMPNKVALHREDDGELLGLMSYNLDEKGLAVEIIYIESADHSNANLLKSNNVPKKYLGIARALFAYAAKVSMDAGFGGVLYFRAKTTELRVYYMKEFGAVPLGQYDPMRMIIWEDAANEIISQYEEVDQNG